jgi:hypothetical protein
MIAGMDWPSFIVLVGLIGLITIVPVVVLRRSSTTRSARPDADPEG